MSKTGMTPGSSGKRPDTGLGQTLLTIIGVGIAGGIALVAGAVKAGEKLLDVQMKAYERIEAEREAYREAVREATANEVEFPAEPRNDELD